MSIHANPDQFDQPSLPFGTGLRETSSLYQPRKMTPSVVEEAGLGSFVYLKGLSGKRYVFSAIETEQSALYSHALFAQVKECGSVLHLNAVVLEANSPAKLYVHVMDSDAVSHIETMADLAVPPSV